MPHSSERQKIALITTSRDHLVYISRLLAAGMSPDVMSDKENPLLISVRGSLGCGKKIIPDGMREYLMGSTALGEITGRPGYDEFWRGQIRGQKVEISYLDAAWLSGYSHEEFASPYIEHVREAFMDTREHGGIAFVHNDYTLDINRRAGLDVWIEKQGVYSPDHSRSRAQQSPLAEAFKKANENAPDNDWIRYIELEVGDKRLLESPKFNDVLDKLCRRYNGVRIPKP